jgi:hypothetical protein
MTRDPWAMVLSKAYLQDPELSKKSSTKIQKEKLRALYSLQVQQVLLVTSFV